MSDRTQPGAAEGLPSGAADGLPSGAAPSEGPAAGPGATGEAAVSASVGPELDDETLAFAHRMFDLARGGHGELLEQVDAGLPVDLTDARGNTLLLLAVYYGQVDVSLGLLERRADPQRENDRGQTPLAAAAFRGLRGVAEALLAAGADPHGGTPSALETARFFEQGEVADLLARHAGVAPPSP
jgi:uncharacterized protein